MNKYNKWFKHLNPYEQIDILDKFNIVDFFVITEEEKQKIYDYETADFMKME